MTEMEIQYIVEEVIRRIRKERTPRFLAVVRSEKEEPQVREYMMMDRGGTIADTLLLSQLIAENQVQNFVPQEKAEAYDGLIFAGLSLKQLLWVTKFELVCPAVEMIVEALRDGKPVIVLSDWFDVQGGTPAFVAKTRNIKQQLAILGVTVVSPKDFESKKTGQNNVESNTADSRFNTTRMGQRVIAKQDLKNVEGGELEIREDAVLTTTAKDLIAQRNIVIKRYSV